MIIDKKNGSRRLRWYLWNKLISFIRYIIPSRKPVPGTSFHELMRLFVCSGRKLSTHSPSSVGKCSFWNNAFRKYCRSSSLYFSQINEIICGYSFIQGVLPNVLDADRSPWFLCTMGRRAHFQFLTRPSIHVTRSPKVLEAKGQREKRSSSAWLWITTHRCLKYTNSITSVAIFIPGRRSPHPRLQ